MSRILARCRGYPIEAYPAMLFVGTSAGIVVGTLKASAHGLDPMRTWGAMLALVAPAILGSRLYYVVQHWSHYRLHRGEILSRQQGGLGLYGGLVACLVLSVPLLRALDLSFAAFWDLEAIVAMIGMITTKVGCHLNGCCAGRLTEGRFGFLLRDANGEYVRRLPSQLMESAVALLLLTILLLAEPWMPFDGALVLLGIVGYGIARYWLEGTRAAVVRVHSVSVNRVVSVALLAVAAAALLAGLAGRPRGRLRPPAEVSANA